MLAGNPEPALDPISQLALGASVAAVLVPRPQLRRALVYGAALAVLPDLDYAVLTGFDPLTGYTLHRSFSHSLLVLTAVAPLFAWLLRRIDYRLQAMSWRRWLLAVWLALATHPLLDAFTSYGTQLWWPLMPPPAMWATIFIIDPLYTVPMLVAVGVAAFGSDLWRMRRALVIGLAVSTAYLGWSVAAKLWVQSQVAPRVAAIGLDPERTLLLPSPFNTILWRVLVMTPGGYAEGWFSLLAPDGPLDLRLVEVDPVDAAALVALPAVERMRWFTHGWMVVDAEGGQAVATDLRMGAEPDYVFRFVVARREGGRWQAVQPRQVPEAPDWRGRWNEQWRRFSGGRRQRRRSSVHGPRTSPARPVPPEPGVQSEGTGRGATHGTADDTGAGLRGPGTPVPAAGCVRGPGFAR